MKARQIILKKFIQKDPFTQNDLKDENGNSVDFSYRQQLWILLRSTNPNEQLSTDEMMKRAQVQFLLEQSEDNKELYLDEGQYTILKNTLDNAKWSGASHLMAEMIENIRTAPEIELEPKSDNTIDTTDKALS